MTHLSKPPDCQFHSVPLLKLLPSRARAQGVFGALIQINSFPSERALSLRERAAGMYYASSYFLAKTTAETIVQLIIPIFFSCTVYWLVGFQPIAGRLAGARRIMMPLRLLLTTVNNRHGALSVRLCTPPDNSDPSSPNNRSSFCADLPLSTLPRASSQPSSSSSPPL